MNSKSLLSGILFTAAAGVTWAIPPQQTAEPLDAPARALAASCAANLPAPVLLWENGVPNAKGDSDEDQPAIYPFLPAKRKPLVAALSLRRAERSPTARWIRKG